MQHPAACVDGRGQPGRINPEVPQQLPAAVGVRRSELEGDPVAGQEVPQLVAARRPLIPDDPVDDMARAVRQRPCRQRLLNLRVKPLLRRDPPLHHERVDPSQRGGTLQGRQLGKGNSGGVMIHRHQQHPARVPVQLVRPVQEVDATHSGQVQVGGHNRYRPPGRGQLLQGGQPRRRRLARLHDVVEAESPGKRELRPSARLRIRVHDEEHGTSRGGLRRFVESHSSHILPRPMASAPTND